MFTSGKCDDTMITSFTLGQSTNMALSLVAHGDSSDSESEEASVPEKKESVTDVRKLLSVLPPAKSKSGRQATCIKGLAYPS